MLEMLGVLAIIGVLSIGAVTGYSYAVTKWKAGEVLTDLHVRALEYTRQMAMAKKIAPEFQFKNFDLGDENSLGNPVAGYPLYEDPDYFEVEVRGVSTEVCRQILRDKSLPILDVAVNGGDYGALPEECGTETPGNLVTMTFLFSKTLEDAGDPLETPALVTQARPDDCPAIRWAYTGVCCAEDEHGTGGHCCPKTSAGWGQNVGRCCAADEGIYRYDSWRYFCCPRGQVWDVAIGACVGGKDQCSSNDDCLANEFCNLKNPTSCTVKPTTGICQSATISHTKTINGVTYKRSNDKMNLWSAENFCARIGGSMASVSDFECGYDFVANKTWGYCNTGTALDQDGSGTRSDTMKKFLSGLGSLWVWTNDDYSDCNAYYISLDGGSVVHLNRANTNYVSALCRMNGS